LKTLAEIAAVIACIIVGLQYLKIEPNALDELPDNIIEIASSNVQALSFKIDENKYINNSSKAYPMYKAAKAISYRPDRDKALEKAVAIAIIELDYKLAILAASNIEYRPDKDRVLSSIALEALTDPDNTGYSVAAAELIEYSPDRTEVINEIIKVYDHVATGGSVDDISLSKKVGIDFYKEVFKFADSSAYIALSSEQAKVFADNWLKTQTYEDFLLFKKVFVFADSSAYLSKDSQESLDFSLKWLKEFNSKDFEVFRESFIFADSSAYMDMDTKNAIKFAFSKVYEQKEANKKINKGT
jgi:hypothetical protein